MPSSPSSGGMLSSWAVATRDKVESKLIDIPFNSGKRRPGDAFERSLWAAFSSYDTLPTVPTKSASLERPKKSPVVHLPPLDPTRFPRLSTAARPSPQPNELSDFTSPQQLAKARRVAARRAREAARKAELDTIARAADTALADERAPARLKEIFKRWDENGDGRISLAEAEAMYQDAMTELMPPAEPAANDDAEDATPPPPPLGCAWLKLEKKPDDGLELKIEKLAEILESGKLEFTPEEMEKSIHGKLRVLWVHGWTARGEGGASEGQMLHRVATALKAHLGLMRNDQAANTFAVYIDKCSLPAQLRDVQYAQARRAQRMNREQAALSDEGANAADVGGIARGNSKSAAEDEEPGEPSEHDAALLACVARLSHRVRRHPHMNKLSV